MVFQLDYKREENRLSKPKKMNNRNSLKNNRLKMNNQKKNNQYRINKQNLKIIIKIINKNKH